MIENNLKQRAARYQLKVNLKDGITLTGEEELINKNICINVYRNTLLASEKKNCKTNATPKQK